MKNTYIIEPLSCSVSGKTSLKDQIRAAVSLSYLLNLYLNETVHCLNLQTYHP